MGTTSSLPTYTEVANALKKTPTKFDAAQTHGLMCGLICATSGKANPHWESMLFGKQKESPTLAILQQLYETSYHQMSEFSFEFSLLLPEDTDDINQRTEALGLWCQGFLTGLEQSKIPIQNHPSPEIAEALDDLIEISQVNYGDIADDDEDETAYFELVEYVRLAALMIFHELKSNNLPNAAGDNNLLH